MKVLYVVGTCLTKNTSANMSHNSYIQGLLENGCDVEILMQNESWGEEDKALPRWENATYYTYNSISFADKLRNCVKRRITTSLDAPESAHNSNDCATTAGKTSVKSVVRGYLKSAFYAVFKPDPIYPLDKTWLKEARAFKSDTIYDLVVSNSSPAASHKMVIELTKRKQIRYKRWVQIWEDPWYFDLYGNHSEAIKNEEHALLQAASEVYYVSPLTLDYQKKYFPDCAGKMKCIPLPFLKIEETGKLSEKVSFGYFGDYYSHTRNLQPFYDALCESGMHGYIYGDSDLTLPSTDKITVSGRVTLDQLASVQAETHVLVHLCNLRGGQIPGKIYHYSGTEKPILFILDGTEEEQKILQDHFSQFDRYFFCSNTKNAILAAIMEIAYCRAQYKGRIVDEFKPEVVTKNLLRG